MCAPCVVEAALWRVTHTPLVRLGRTGPSGWPGVGKERAQRPPQGTMYASQGLGDGCSVLLKRLTGQLHRFASLLVRVSHLAQMAWRVTLSFGIGRIRVHA